MPHDDSAHAYRFAGRGPPEEGAEMRAAPFVLGYDARFIGTQDPPYSDGEIRKTFPVLAVALGRLLGTNERLRHAGDVIEAIRGHASEQCLHVMLALGANVFAQNRHPFCRYLHPSTLPRACTRERISGVNRPVVLA